MKNLVEFLEVHSTNPDLHKKVWKQGGLNFEDVKKHPKKYANAYSGLVPGFSYIKDVNLFYKKNDEDIKLHLMSFKDDRHNILVNRPDDFATNSTWLVWFAWTSFMSELISYLEI